MIAYYAKKLTGLLERFVPMNDEERTVYTYAFDIALYTVLSTTALLIIGIICGQLVHTVICIALFYINQSVGGGYHASTHGKCFMTMAIGLLIYLITFMIEIPVELYIVGGGISLLFLIQTPLVLHKNKQYLLKHEQQLKFKSRLFIVIQAIAFVLLNLWCENADIIHAYGLGLSVCAISRAFASKE